MSIEWVLYFIDVLEKVPLTLSIVSITFFFIVVIHIGAMIKSGVRPRNIEWLSLAFSVALIFSSIFSYIFIPSEKTMYAIAFAHYSKQSEIPAKVLKAIEVKLDEVIEGVKK
jgi:hypothetical protein